MYPVSDWIQVRNGSGVKSIFYILEEFWSFGVKFFVRIDFSNRYHLSVLLNIFDIDRMLYIIFVNCTYI